MFISSPKMAFGCLLLSGFSCSLLLAQPERQGIPELVTVVAKKRSLSERQVDISMDVFTGQDARALQLNYLPQLADYSANVSMFEDLPGANIPTWVIRGVGLQDFNTNNTPTASVFLDEAYQVSTAMGGAALFDMQQVEILKGPQGGLYGRNTSGGAVLLNTRRAQLGEREGYLELGYGRWDRSTFTGAYNLPLNEVSALRLAGRVEKGGDGWQHSLSGGDAHGEPDRWDLRAWFRYEPGEDFSAHLKLQSGRDDSDIALGRSVGLYGPDGKLCSAVMQGYRDDANCMSWAGFTQLVLTGEVADAIDRQSDDGALVLSDPVSRQNNEYDGALLELSWQLPAFRLMSISAADRFDYGVLLDLDGGSGEFAHRVSGSGIDVLRQEFRLIGNDGNRLQWLAGISYSDESFSERRDFVLRDNLLVQQGTGLAEVGRVVYEQDTEALAVYGDLDYALNDAWSLSGALRYTSEDKDYYDGAFYAPEIPFYYSQNLSSDYSLDSHWSGSISLNWTPDANALWYLKFSRGFKSGGFYGGFPFDPAEIEPYQEETISAVELGLKQEFPDAGLILDAAVFSYDYQDVQGFIRSVSQVTNTAVDVLGNQGDATHLGAEMNLRWLPGDNWRVDFGLGWLDAEFEASGVFTVGTNGELVEIRGQRPWAPRWNGNLQLNYSQPVAASMLLELALGWNYRSGFSGHSYSPVDTAINDLPGYALVDASAMLGGRDGLWQGTLWVRNLTDRTYRTRVKADGLQSYIETFGQPRSFGVSLRRKL